MILLDNDDLKYFIKENNIIPKFKIGDKVNIKSNFKEIHNNTFKKFKPSYLEGDDVFNLYPNAKNNIITRIKYSKFNNGYIIGYFLNDQIYYLTEECLEKEKPNYNEPKQLVYEKLNTNIKMVVFITEKSIEEKKSIKKILIENGYNLNININRDNNIKVFYIDKLKKNVKYGSNIERIDSNVNSFFGYNNNNIIKIYDDIKELKKCLNIIPNPINMYNEPKELVYEKIKNFKNFKN